MQGIKKLSLMTVCITAMVCTMTAQAAVQIPYGWYVEGNVGASRTSNVDYGSGASVSSWGSGWGVNGGYKFTPYFAGEVGYTHYAQAKIRNSAGALAAKNSHYAVDIAGKGILPISDSGFELFGKLGFASVRSNLSITDSNAASSLSLQTGSHTANGIFLGAGADYSFTPNLPVVVQWARAKGDGRTGSLDLFSVGVSYLFG